MTMFCAISLVRDSPTRSRARRSSGRRTAAAARGWSGSWEPGDRRGLQRVGQRVAVDDRRPGLAPSPRRSAGTRARSPPPAGRTRCVSPAPARRRSPSSPRTSARRPAGAAAPSAGRCRCRGPSSVRAAVEQAARRRSSCSSVAAPGRTPGPGQLVVAARLGGLQQRRAARRPAAACAGGAAVRVDVQVDRRGRLPQHGLHDRRCRSRAPTPLQHQLDVVAGRHLGVAGHVPGGASSTARGPASRRARRVPSVERRQRPLVQPDLGVGQVVVVEQQQVRLRARRPAAGTSVRAPSMSISTRSRRTSAARRSRSYRPMAIRCERSVGCSAGRLLQRRRTTCTGPRRPSSNSGRSVLTPAVSQPLLRPGGQVATGGLLQLAEQVAPAWCCPTRAVEVRRRRRRGTRPRPTQATSCLSTAAPLA